MKQRMDELYFLLDCNSSIAVVLIVVNGESTRNRIYFVSFNNNKIETTTFYSST